MVNAKKTLLIGLFVMSSMPVYSQETSVNTNNVSTSTSTVESTNTNNNNNVNTSTSTVDSTSTNTNNNNNVNTSTSTSTNTNVNTNNNINSGDQTIRNVNSGEQTFNYNNVSNATNTNNNNNVNTSTSVNDNLNTNVNINSGEQTFNNNTVSTSRNTNNNNNVNTSTSVSTSTNANNNVNTNNNTSVSDNVNRNIQSGEMTNRNINETRIDQTVRTPPPTAVAPAMMSGGNSDLCTTGTSGSVQTQILGVATGGTVRDMNCERLKNAKVLYDMGMKVAAVATLCQDRRVFDAMWNAGTPCPYEGMIGERAKTAWMENPDKIPKPEEIKSDDFYKKTGFGALLGALLFKLF
jgi:hypothetical protein